MHFVESPLISKQVKYQGFPIICLQHLELFHMIQSIFLVWYGKNSKWRETAGQAWAPTTPCGTDSEISHKLMSDLLCLIQQLWLEKNKLLPENCCTSFFLFFWCMFYQFSHVIFFGLALQLSHAPARIFYQTLPTFKPVGVILHGWSDSSHLIQFQSYFEVLSLEGGRRAGELLFRF